MKKPVRFWLIIGVVAVVVVIAGVVFYYERNASLAPSRRTNIALSSGIPPVSAAYPITYVSNAYGFTFSLPADWQGYTIVTSTWTGTVEGACPAKGCPSVTGPEVLIRNPKWTTADPYQDIPILVFTHSEWNAVSTTSPMLVVSAAPIPPSELGENAKYVFALPPRYDYAYPNGWQEVESIIASNPLRAF